MTVVKSGQAVAVIIGIICLLLSNTAANGLKSGQANENDIQVADNSLTKRQSSEETGLKKCGQLNSENCPVVDEQQQQVSMITTTSNIKAPRSKRSSSPTNSDLIDGSVGYRSVRGGLDRNFLRFGRKGGGLDKNFLRFGRGGLDKNFLRFGRNIWQLQKEGESGISDNGQVDVNRINQVLENLRRTEEREDDEEEEEEMNNSESFQKHSDYNQANPSGLEVDNVQSDQLKTKRGSLNNNFLRYGRRYSTNVYSGKRGSLDRNFLRFGKRSLKDTNGNGQDDHGPNRDGENVLVPCSSGQECDYQSTAPPGDAFSKLIKKRSLLDGHWMTTTEEEEDNDGVKSIRRGRSLDHSVLGGDLQENFIRFGKR